MLYSSRKCFFIIALGFIAAKELPKPDSCVICPPSLECSEIVQREDPSGWKLRVGYDKSLSQRTYELLMLYEWVDVDKTHVSQALAIAEAARQLMCAATVARCDAALLRRAIDAARSLVQNSGNTAESTFEVCGADDLDLTACLRGALTWAEAEYVRVLAPYGEIDFDIESDARNRFKTSASTDYPMPMYPAAFSPQAVCELGGSARHTEWPLFGGEAFGGVTWVDVTNLRTRHLGFLQVLELLENGANFRTRHPGGLSAVAVNFGAGDGVCRVAHSCDPANCMYAAGAGGVLFEANPELHPSLLEVYGNRQPEVVIVPEAADPATVSSRLAEALGTRPGPPLHHSEIDMIKVDVDGCDCALVEALIGGGWRPKVWHVEINPLFPPGVVVRPRDVAVNNAASTLGSAFSHNRHGESVRDGSEFLIGCSLQALLEIVGPEYALLHVEFENAVLIRQDLAQAVEPWLSAYDDAEKWRIGYFCNPMARIRAPHDMDDNSLFLHYDFRRWGDSSLSSIDMANEVARFLRHFSALDGYDVAYVDPSKLRSLPLGTTSLNSYIGSAGQGSKPSAMPDDLDCKEKGEVLNWDSVYESVVRVLNVWSSGKDRLPVADLSGLIVALTELFASQFNLDHSWQIFKTLTRGECPLGGLCVVVLLRWRCASPPMKYSLERNGPLDRLFDALDSQLPLLHTHSFVPPKLGFGRPSELGCQALFDRYLEAVLHRIDLTAAFKSRWPVFELLSALHSESIHWPRGYP